MAQKLHSNGTVAHKLHSYIKVSENVAQTGCTLTILSKNILKILQKNPEGLRAINLIDKTGKPRRTIYYNLRLLESLELVQNIYPIWKLCNFQGTPLNVAQLLKSDKIQLHDFSYVIRLIKTPGWWDKRSNKFLRLNIRQLKWGNNPYHQQKQDDFLIQIFSNSMIFINQKKYWGKDTYDCLIQATSDFLKAYEKIEDMFRFRFFPDGVPNVSIRSQHYVNINDLLAEKCKKEGKKFCVVVNDKRRVWVDLSEPFGMEAGHKDYAPEDLRNYDRQVKDFITKNPPVNSELSKDQQFITDAIKDMTSVMGGIQDNQVIFDKNMKSHIKVIQQMATGFSKFNKLLSERQKRLGDY